MIGLVTTGLLARLLPIGLTVTAGLLSTCLPVTDNGPFVDAAVLIVAEINIDNE